MLSPPLMLLLKELVAIITRCESPTLGLLRPDVNKVADRKRITFHSILKTNIYSCRD